MTALVELYADESESAGVLTVAAFLFTKEKAQALHKEWAPVLEAEGLPFFRMVDCAHGSGNFKKLNKKKRVDLQIKIFDILKRNMGCGLSVSFDLAHKDMLPSSINLGIAQVSPYAMCCHWLLLNARRWVEENHPEAKISYFFEAGDANQAQANAIFSTLYNNAWHRNHFKMASFSFVNKHYSACIQAADILAWQWSKNIKDRNEGKLKPRADLSSLLESPQNFTTHFDGKTLAEYVGLIRSVSENS